MRPLVVDCWRLESIVGQCLVEVSSLEWKLTLHIGRYASLQKFCAPWLALGDFVIWLDAYLKLPILCSTHFCTPPPRSGAQRSLVRLTVLRKMAVADRRSRSRDGSDRKWTSCCLSSSRGVLCEGRCLIDWKLLEFAVRTKRKRIASGGILFRDGL
jgi:hypothetical protein